MNRSFVVITSPVSGSGRGLRTLPIVEAFLRSRGWSFDSHLTESLDHAREISEAAVAGAAGRLGVIVIGGDGLFHAVLPSVAGVSVPLAVVPAGTGNDFARSIGIHGTSDVLGAIDADSIESIDVGSANGSLFGCIASAGFDSRVIEAARRVRLLRGRSIYPYAVMKALWGWRPATFFVEVDGGSRQLVGYSVVVANGKYYGGGMQMAPEARLDDALLDVVMLGHCVRPRFLLEVVNVFSGTHVNNDRVSMVRGRTVRLDADRPFEVFADGEPVGPLPLEVTTLPGALDVYLPEKQESRC